MKILITCIFASIILLATLPASALDYYVDPSSSGANLGTITDPWKSIADIPVTVNYFLPGDTVFFKRDQQYWGTLSINSTGSYSSPIVFMPYGSGNAPIIQYNLANPAEPNPADRIIIRLNQVNYIVIDGFELTDATISETDHSVTANVGHGVYIYNGPGNNGYSNIIKNCTISRLGGGITIDGGSYNTVTNCTIRNLRMVVNTPNINWDDYGAVGIVLGGSDNTIIHNRIEGCWAPSYDYQYDGGAIEMYGYAVSNNKILYNTAIDNLGWMEFGSGSGGTALNDLVAYNLLINNGHVFWINVGNGFGMTVLNLQLFNNNIIETSAPRIANVTSLIGIFTTPTVSNVINSRNNIFYLTTPLNITDPVLQPFNGQQLVHQNNLYYINGGSLGYTLDASERILNSSAPLFMNTTSGDPASWNYALQPTSVAIDFGQYLGISQDFYGQAVPSGNAPDAGIAEYSFIALPLQIISSKGWAGANGNTIEWVINNEPADHFEIERSNDGNNFKTIATVPYQTNAGSTTVKYQIIDNDVQHEVQYYRVKAIEPGNTVLYSPIITIKNSTSLNNMIVSPNPAQGEVYLSIKGNNFLNKEMVLVNMWGQVLKRVKLNDTNSQIKLNVSMLPHGAYVIKLMDKKTGQVYTTTFAK
jgi:hypothetical protein